MNNLSHDLHEVKFAINRLRDEKSAITIRKAYLEHEMQKLNARVRTMKRIEQRDKDYASICNKQVNIKSKILEIDKQIMPINSKLRQLYMKEDVIRTCANLSLPTHGDKL